MPYASGRIRPPVGVEDMKRGVGENSNDAGTLCGSEKVNKWSKYKPVRSKVLGMLEEDEFCGDYSIEREVGLDDTALWVHAWGLKFLAFTNLSKAAQFYVNSIDSNDPNDNYWQVNFDYEKIRANVDWARFTDMRHYDNKSRIHWWTDITDDPTDTEAEINIQNTDMRNVGMTLMTYGIGGNRAGISAYDLLSIFGTAKLATAIYYNGVARQELTSRALTFGSEVVSVNTVIDTDPYGVTAFNAVTVYLVGFLKVEGSVLNDILSNTLGLPESPIYVPITKYGGGYDEDMINEQDELTYGIRRFKLIAKPVGTFNVTDIQIFSTQRATITNSEWTSLPHDFGNTYQEPGNFAFRLYDFNDKAQYTLSRENFIVEFQLQSLDDGGSVTKFIIDGRKASDVGRLRLYNEPSGTYTFNLSQTTTESVTVPSMQSGDESIRMILGFNLPFSALGDVVLSGNYMLTHFFVWHTVPGSSEEFPITSQTLHFKFHI